MRVAMVGLRAPWGPEGGVEAAMASLAPQLVRRGAEVTVYCRGRYNTLGPGEHEGVRLVDTPTVYTKHLEAFVHTGLSMPAAIRGADLVHVHATGPALWSWAPRLFGVPSVVTVHGLDWQRDKWGPTARMVLRAGAWGAGRFPSRLITVSQDLAAVYERQGVSATWIPNGVDPIDPVPLHEAGLEGLSSGRFLLLLGRLVPEKGIDGLLRAYAASGIDLPLLIVGGASYSEDYAARLRADAPPGVVLTGPLHGRRRDALLTHARALVLPSLLEGFPLAPLESLSAGRPVLLSDIPPHRELLGESEAGWLVPPSPERWSEALRALATTSDDELDRRGALGREHVRRHFSWEQVADRTLEVYRSALDPLGVRY